MKIFSIFIKYDFDVTDLNFDFFAGIYFFSFLMGKVMLAHVTHSSRLIGSFVPTSLTNVEK